MSTTPRAEVSTCMYGMDGFAEGCAHRAGMLQEDRSCCVDKAWDVLRRSFETSTASRNQSHFRIWEKDKSACGETILMGSPSDAARIGWLLRTFRRLHHGTLLIVLCAADNLTRHSRRYIYDNFSRRRRWCQEARVLARALMVGQRRNQLGPLPASRLRHLRAELLADVKAAKMVSGEIDNFHRLSRHLVVEFCFPSQRATRLSSHDITISSKLDS